MAVFNTSKPYGTVHGQSGAKYYQDGVYYDAQYNPIDTEDDVIDDIVDSILDKTDETPADTVAPDLGDDSPAETLQGQDPAPPADTPDTIDFDAMPWQKVKKLVEDAGGMWTNKIEGIAYLKGL